MPCSAASCAGRPWEGEPLERLHRDTGGNPRRLLLAAAAEPGAFVSDSIPSEGRTPLAPPPARMPAREDPSSLAWQSPAIGEASPR